MVEYFRSTLRDIPQLLRPIFMRKGWVYTWSTLRADTIAGATVACIQIPQAMALALIAGLPAVYGLYASFVGFIAALWGSSRVLSTGPVAIVSFLTFTSLVPFAEPRTPEYIQLAALLAFLVGCMYLLMGFFRLGFLLNLVPHSVIQGFASAAALIIIVSQIPTFFGISITQHELVLQNVLSIFRGISGFSLVTTFVGISALALLIIAKKLPKMFPSALIVLFVGIAASFFFSLGDYGVALVRDLPRSIPNPSLPILTLSTFLLLLPKAGIISFVGFVEAYACAKAAAKTTKEKIDTDQELVGQGLGNIVAGFFKGFPMSGSFTRTAVNTEAGAQTGFASAVASLVTLLALVFFGPFFELLPRAVLSAIVILAALSIIHIDRLKEMYRVSPTDGLVAFLTFGLSFFIKPDEAIFIGMLAALLLFIRQTVWGARIVEMGVHKEWNILRNAEDTEHVEVSPGTLIVRVGMSLYFANTAHIMKEIEKLITAHTVRTHTQISKLVLDMSGTNFIDISGLETFSEFVAECKKKDMIIALLYTRRAVNDTLGKFHEFPTVVTLHNIAEMREFVLNGKNWRLKH